MRSTRWTWAIGLHFLLTSPGFAAPIPIIDGVEFQPLVAQVRRVVEALGFLGQPLNALEREAMENAARSGDGKRAVRDIQRVLDRHCLFFVEINPESRVKARAGRTAKRLVEQGWSTFLVKVHNEAGVTAPLTITSPNALPLQRRSSSAAEPKPAIPPGEVAQRFLDVQPYRNQPMAEELSGLQVEYQIVELFSRDAGKREAKFAFHVGQGTQDTGFRNEVSILFDCQPASTIRLRIRDVDGKPAMASFLFRDKSERVYPSPARRLEPDFFFHPQIYRTDGETVRLPPGEYSVEYTRGPEYRVLSRKVQVNDSAGQEETFALERWIEPKKLGWWSGDHHVHAAGCAHYESPTQGVTPEAMFRHILGEDLNVGCVLSWGPCWYFQKQFFEGKVSAISRPEYLMRYDVEVSGFPSSHCGHLCLLRLKEDDFPNTRRIEEWPSWDLPILRWGKEQGGIVGFSHSGWGLQVESDQLPNLLLPPYDGIGANEYVVDVVHGVCDFISAVDTPAPWELNIWYHTNNCGMTAKISGETDFPCIYGERVGLGRVYVKLDGPLDFDQWAEGIKQGRSYVSDGLSHLIDFRAGAVPVGTRGSRLDLPAPGNVTVTAKVAALLPEKSDPSIRKRPINEKPYWHIERARIGESRQVPVEVVVNGEVVARKEIVADGQMRPLQFEVPIQHSSWVAMRIYPSSHTNPVYVHVAGKPIRASKASARWCAQGVEQCWKKKSPLLKVKEREAAKKAFDQAHATYLRIAEECGPEPKPQPAKK